MFRDVGTSNRKKARATGLILLPSLLPPTFLSITEKGKRDKIIMKKNFPSTLDRVYSIVHQHSTMTYEGLSILVSSKKSKLQTNIFG